MFESDFWQKYQYAVSVHLWLVICTVATAYSMGQIIQSVCIYLSVYLSASTLTVAFLDRFSPKLAHT